MLQAAEHLNGSTPMPPADGGLKLKWDLTINLPSIMAIVAWAFAGAWWLAVQGERIENLEKGATARDVAIQRITDNQVIRGERVAKLEEGQAAVLRILTEINRKLDK